MRSNKYIHMEDKYIFYLLIKYKWLAVCRAVVSRIE